MGRKDIFKNRKLQNLYKTGKLDNLISTYNKYINETNLLGKGNDASTFIYKNEKLVIKVCSKDIGYLQHYGDNIKHFKKHINQLEPYFAPIDKILYEDANVFVYTQRRCVPIKNSDVNPDIVINFFKFVIFMLDKGLLLTDLPPHNVGFLDGRLICFDYHGLGPIRQSDYCWKRLIRNLTRFIALIYSPDKFKEYEILMHGCDDSVISTLEDDDNLPKCFIDIVHYFNDNKNNLSIPVFQKYLKICIDEIKRHFTIIPKKIKVRNNITF